MIRNKLLEHNLAMVWELILEIKHLKTEAHATIKFHCSQIKSGNKSVVYNTTDALFNIHIATHSLKCIKF